MTVDLEVILQDPAWSAAVADAAACCEAAAAAALAAAAPAAAGGVCIVLAGDDDVRALNAHYRGEDKATDVLSFPYSAGPDGAGPDGDGAPPDGGGDDQTAPDEAAPLGDVILAFGICSADAAAEAKPLRNHLSHLVVHGILHILGYDHVTEDDAHIMEALETRILAGLGLPDPYAPFPHPDNGTLHS